MDADTRERIERLRAHCNSTYDVMMAFMGWDTVSPSQDYCGNFKSALIDLLERSDPDTHMELPVDVDGVPIHVGDEMERGSTHGRVVALMLSNYPKKWNGGRLHWGVQLEGEQAPTALDNRFHHYHKPTVEDVLTEFADRVCNSGHQWGLDAADTIAEYAKRLRLAEVDE